MSSFSLEKNKFPSVDLTCWADQLITAFTILNCLEYEFLKGFLVQGRQQSFWEFSILSNILKLPWCLPNKRNIHSQLPAKFTCRDGKCGKLSSYASRMLYKEPLDQSDCWKLFVQLWNYTKMQLWKEVNLLCSPKGVKTHGSVHERYRMHFKPAYHYLL